MTIPEQINEQHVEEQALSADGLWYAIDMAPTAVSFHWPGCPVTFK